VKRVIAILLIGSAALMVQGSVNAFLPPHVTPNFGYLIIIGVGLHWRSAAAGIGIAAVLGFTADLLSGSLLGEQALLGMLAFVAARFVSQQLNLRGALPQALFVFALTGVNALGIGVLDTFFGIRGGIGATILQYLPVHALANAVFAPFVARGVEVLASASGSEEGGRRQVYLPAARRPV
jgi:rod shape-determining protein MreD